MVRLWTRRLQRCVEVLDAMQVPAWLRKPFSTSYMSPQKKCITAHLSYFIIMYSLHGVSYTDLSCPYPFEAARIFQDAVGCDRAFFFASAALTKDRISSSA